MSLIACLNSYSRLTPATHIYFTSTNPHSYQVRENVKAAQFRVRTKTDNVSGVQLPVFECYREGAGAFELTGLGRGGQQVQKCKDTFAKSLEILVELASLQVRFELI